MIDIKTGADLREWRKKNKLSIPKAHELLSYSQSRLEHIECENIKISKRLKKRVERLNAELNPLEDFVEIFLSLYNKKEFFNSIPDIINELTEMADIHIGGELNKVDKLLELFLESIKVLNSLDTMSEEECKEHYTKLYKQAHTYIQSK